MQKNIIQTENGLVLANGTGARLVIHQQDGRYGLGTFFVGDNRVGGSAEAFLYEESHYVWDQFQATRYELVENTPEIGVITFYGTNGIHNIETNWLVTITMTADSPAFRINAQVEPYLWPGRYHPLYMAFSFDNDAMECVSYPMEAPILPPYSKHWTVKPDIGKVPMLLGREKINGQSINVAVGYTLDYAGQDYTQGALIYDSTEKGLSMRINFPYSHYWIPAQHTWDSMASPMEDGPFAPGGIPNKVFRHGPPYVLDMVVSVAQRQSDCVFGYKNLCGYNSDTVVRHDVIRAVDQMMEGYNTDARWIYEQGVGYRMRAWSNSDEKANYYDFITFASNALLSYLLYKYWLADKSREWAKQRAIEMVEFSRQKQIASGAIPRCWDIDNDTPHGMGDDFYAWGLVYCAMTTATCAMYTDKLLDLMAEHGQMVPDGWRAFADKGMDWVVNMVNKENGGLKHSYREDEVGALNGIEPHALHALRYFFNKTGDARYGEAMVKYENYLYDSFAVNNDWYNGILDCNSLKKPIEGEQYKNYYTLNVFDLAGYFHDRYIDTGDEKFLHWAADNFAFGWMGRMPVNMPGFAKQTKGIIEEQNIWVFYDLPWPFNSSAGLLRMARTLDDPFYAQYFKLAVNTQLEFAHLDDIHPFCSQVLGCNTDARQPLDRFAEIVDGKFGIWLTGYSTLFIHDMLRDDVYCYVGGRGWGVGIDYDVDFDTDLGDGLYIAAASNRVTSAQRAGSGLCVQLTGAAKPGRQLILGGLQRQAACVYLDGVELAVRQNYDAKRRQLTLWYDQPGPSVALTIQI